MTERRVTITIGEMVVEGFAAAGAEALRRAVERELARLVAEGGIPFDAPENAAAVSENRGARMAAAPGGALSGARLARALYGALRR